jgi:hypothetical protein
LGRLLFAAITIIVASALAPFSVSAAPGTRARAAGGCALFAAPWGVDRRGGGSLRRPLRSLRRLDRALRPGETGCLMAGTYGSTATWHEITTNGRPGARITIRSVPGQTATVIGYVDIEASYATLSHLRIDGSNTLFKSHPGGVPCRENVSQPLVIAGHDDVLESDDYFQSIPQLRGNGIGIGFWGNADNTIIRYSKIHDVGQCQAYDQLIYLAHGNNVRIYGNWMWNDRHGRGVQLYPGPTNARVFENVIDHVGEGFVIGDEPGETVSGNQITDNIVSNATGLRWENIRGQAIHDLYGGKPGTGNTFHNNIVFHNPAGVGRLTNVSAYHNVIANPGYADAAQHDFRVQASIRSAFLRASIGP